MFIEFKNYWRKNNKVFSKFEKEIKKFNPCYGKKTKELNMYSKNINTFGEFLHATQNALF